MASIMDEFMQSLPPEVSGQLSANLGIERNAVEQMLPQIAPMILGGLKRQKDNFGGQERVDHILDKYGSADVLDNIGDFFSDSMQSAAGILHSRAVSIYNKVRPRLTISCR